jgi:hypothetical protein
MFIFRGSNFCPVLCRLAPVSRQCCDEYLQIQRFRGGSHDKTRILRAARQAGSRSFQKPRRERKYRIGELPQPLWWIADTDPRPALRCWLDFVAGVRSGEPKVHLQVSFP